MLAFIIYSTAAAQAAAAEKILFHADSFVAAPGTECPAGWTTAGRLAAFPPDFSVAAGQNLGGPGSLSISGAAGQAASGSWRTEVKGIDPAHCYRFEACFYARGVPWPERQAMARLYWLDSQGQRAAMPEYVPEAGQSGDWQRVAATYRPPKDAVAARIELFLSHCPQGTVWWDDITLAEVPEPAVRLVKVGAANCRPTGSPTNMGMAEQFVPVIEQAGRMGCDILLLGETITLPARGDVPALEKAEPVPGPITDRFGELARRFGMYIIVGLLENEHGTLYNTAALIDRQGRVAGKYRKVHLPLEDLESGVTPGDHYPVFDTDFGRIGIVICYDIQFVDPARNLTVQGAEIIFCPNWGSDFPVNARAIENQVYIASSGYDTPTDIVDPRGEVIARADSRPAVAFAEIDLNRGSREAGFARRRQYLLRELRPDIIVPGYSR
ncbi:MAG: carbon-nitrogen hydrolase family protein [Candidatus Glassbacteria bacterium]